MRLLLFLLGLLTTAGCYTPFLHTQHAPLIPLAARTNDLVASGSFDFTGGSADIQYKYSQNLGVFAQVQGFSRTFYRNGFSSGSSADVYRSAWNTSTGICVLKYKPTRYYYFPFMVGVQGGGVNQTPLFETEENTLKGNYGAAFAQQGVMFRSNVVQLYLGYRLSALQYFGIKSQELDFRTVGLIQHQYTAQLAIWGNNKAVFRGYSAVSFPGSASKDLGTISTGFPLLNVGVGFGLNLNRDKQASQKD